MTDKLRKCPFCGSNADFYFKSTNKNQIKICCLATDSNFHGTDGVIDDWCPMKMETPFFDSKEKAIEVWNTRPESAEIETLRSEHKFLKSYRRNAVRELKRLWAELETLQNENSELRKEKEMYQNRYHEADRWVKKFGTDLNKLEKEFEQVRGYNRDLISLVRFVERRYMETNNVLELDFMKDWMGREKYKKLLTGEKEDE